MAMRLIMMIGGSLLLSACTMISGASDLSTGAEECTGVCPTGTGSGLKQNTDSTDPKKDDKPKADIRPVTPDPAKPQTDPDPEPTKPEPEPEPEPKPVNQVECGNKMCSGDDAACCVGDQGSTKECRPSGGQCAAPAAAVVTCGGRSNCGAGEICCLKLAQGKAECTAEGACGSRFVFCRTSADCPNNEPCVDSTGSFTDHKVCVLP